MRGMRAVCVAAIAAMGGVGGTAVAGPTDRAELELGLGSQAAGSGSGLSLHVVYRDPANPEGKPSPIEKVVVNAPEGTRFDTAALPPCTASDDEFRMRGLSACPPETKVGEGKLIAFTGTPADPVRADLTLFNGREELVEVVSFEGTDRVAGIDRLHVDGSRLTGNPPATPGGPPDGRTAVHDIRFTIPARTGAGGRSYITTPARCPSSRVWTSTGDFGFADGSTAFVRATTPCRPPARPRLAVSPGRVRAGRSATYRFRVLPAGSACARGSAIRFAGRRLRTDGSGRASARVRLNRTGARNAWVVTRGCRARATVRVSGG